MNKGEFNPVFALRNEKIVHISEVERGRKCGCKCPVCNGLLIARKGEQLSHHFAHYAKTNCEYSGESALHFAAKELLSKAKKMVIPAVSLKFPDSCRPDELIHEAMEIDIDRVDCEKYFGNRTKNKELGQILKAIDARMREKYEYSALLKPENVTKLVMNIIEKEITKVLEEKKKNVVPAIEIDVAKLSGIRRAAELTKARLIVEGSEEDAEVEEAKFEDVEFKNVDMEQMEFVWENSVEREEKRAEPIFASGEDTENGKETALFDQAECILLRGLLYGEPYQDFLREHRIMLSIVVDAVNEKLFDYFADTTIVFDGDVPQILADYQEEVAAILKKEQKF